MTPNLPPPLMTPNPPPSPMTPDGNARGRGGRLGASARKTLPDENVSPSEDVRRAAANNKSQPPLLEVDRLVVRYATDAGEVSAVEDVSFSLHRGEAMGLVGESGCGKTSIALSLLRLAPENTSYPSGSIRWEGVDLLGLSSEEMRRLRWAEISMVFQGAMNAWNPVYRVGHQIREAMEQHFNPRLAAGRSRPDARPAARVGRDWTPLQQTAIPTNCRAACVSGP